MLRKFFVRAGGIVAAGALAATLALGAPAPASAAATPDTTVSAQLNNGRPGGRQQALRVVSVRALVRTTADLTGKEVSAVRQALVDGQSLAQFAAANGSSGDAVVKAVVDKASERISKAVTDGRISQEFADAMVKELTRKATELVNDTTLGQKIAERTGR